MFSSPFNKTIISALSYLPMHTTCSVLLTLRDRNPTPLCRVPPPPLRDVNSGLALKRLSTHFMEPKGSWRCLQESATKLYPWPNTSSPHPPNLKPLLILYSYSSLRIWSSLFPSGFPNDTLYAFIDSSMRDTCPSNSYPFTSTVQVTADYAYHLWSSSLYPFLQLNSSLLHPTVFIESALLRKY
jgi:hypothetical protein